MDAGKHLDHGTMSTFEPVSEAFDRLATPAWLRGPLPQLPVEYAKDWWQGPCGARATVEEMEAAPPPAMPRVKGGAPRPGFFRRLFGG